MKETCENKQQEVKERLAKYKKQSFCMQLPHIQMTTTVNGKQSISIQKTINMSVATCIQAVTGIKGTNKATTIT